MKRFYLFFVAAGIAAGAFMLSGCFSMPSMQEMPVLIEPMVDESVIPELSGDSTPFDGAWFRTINKYGDQEYRFLGNIFTNTTKTNIGGQVIYAVAHGRFSYTDTTITLYILEMWDSNTRVVRESLNMRVDEYTFSKDKLTMKAVKDTDGQFKEVLTKQPAPRISVPDVGFSF
jgi:hypothetical protein